MNKHSCDCESCQHKVCAKRVPIFSILTADEISRVVNLIKRKQYSRGEMIIMEGSRLDSLIIVNSGQVKAFKDTLEGKEQILYIFSQGDFFGEKNLLANHNATYNVEALEVTNVCTIKKDDFQQLLREYPEIGFKIIETLCSRLERLENAIESMGTKDVEARVNAVLLEFARKYGQNNHNGIVVELPLSREGIANYIGVSRETVSRKMSLLQDEGIIEMVGNKKIIIRNIDAL